jgi:hypothetical protein
MLPHGMGRGSKTANTNANARAIAFAFVFAIVAFSSAARADDEPSWLARKSGYAQLFATALIGSGLRFNNPYRLATPLSSSAESVSRTATYVDVGLAATFGDPLGLQHGPVLRAALALEGVPQSVFTPSYVLYRRFASVAIFGRAGVPLVVTPSNSAGVEVAMGGVLFVRGGIGIVGELVGDLFYGAGTRERAMPTYPALSGQVGFLIAYELLP